MILFIAPNPHTTKVREGFLQRVAAIDEIFEGEERIYFDDLKNSVEIARVMIRARLIYVHSIYQAEKILSSYDLFGTKIVTDMHGVVPEEEEYSGNGARADQMTRVEKEVFTYGKIFVGVTNAMVQHFSQKYREAARARWIVLPIFESKGNLELNLQRKRDLIVYAGGTQAWQNVPLMVGAINRLYKKYGFTILTHNPNRFTGLNAEARAKTVIKSVPSTEVERYYHDAKLGFILRDDITINRVACPTKMIEYLSNGVVPIVLSPYIGDFYELHYGYVTYEDFVSGAISGEALQKAAQKNGEIVSKLEAVSESGKRKLKRLYGSLKTNGAGHINTLLQKVVEQNCKIAELESKLQHHETEIKNQRNVIADKERIIEVRTKTIENILNSKRWKAIEATRHPLQALARKGKTEGMRQLSTRRGKK